MNLIIQNGHVMDPGNNVDEVRSIYIKSGKISDPYPVEEADKLLDATGKVVCPGFIDIHMHEDPVLADGRLYDDPEKAIFNCMLRMGVTTAVGGNCGENVCHPADYLDLIDRQGCAVNVAMLAGHGYFRETVGCLDKYAPATDEQVTRMAESLRESLERGCIGVSYGIRYVPGLNRRELLETASVCREAGTFAAAHIRDDAEAVFSAAEEFLDLGKTLGIPLQLSHIGSMAGFGQMKRFLDLVAQYRSEGIDVDCDCYPYAAFSTDIGETTYDDGWMERYQCDYSAVELSEGKYKGQRCTWETFEEMRRDFPLCKTVCYVMQQDDVDLAFRDAHVMLASDGTLSMGQGHPRAAGTFPRLLGLYVRSGKLSLSDAIARMTSMPARKLGFPSKGHLGVGADADIVVFDPETIADCATFLEPLLPPVGIEHVLLGGAFAIRNGQTVCRTLGRSLRRLSDCQVAN